MGVCSERAWEEAAARNMCVALRRRVRWREKNERSAYQRHAASWTSVERDFDMESIVERVEGARRGVSTSVSQK